MSRSETDDLVVLGYVAGAYGVKGWVKIVSHTEPREGIFNYVPWRISDTRGGWRDVRLVSGRPQGKGLVAQIEGCETRDDAGALRGAEIAVAAGQLEQLEDGDYYWHQLEGMDVFNSSGADAQHLGVVDHLMSTGANDVMVVKPSVNSIDDKERLVPYLPERVVRSVDIEAARIEVDWDADF